MEGKAKAAFSPCKCLWANQTESHGGNRYFLLFIDDCTRMSWVYLLMYKHEVFSCFQKFQDFVERQIGQKLKIIRTD